MSEHSAASLERPLFPVATSLIVGIVGLGLCALGALFDPTQMFRAYLTAYLFWIALPLGCLALLMIHANTGGRWGLALQRTFESATETFPLMVLLFVPIVLGMQHIYVWSIPEVAAEDYYIRRKTIYLNVPFFVLRAASFFAAWIGTSYLMNRWSSTTPGPYDGEAARRRQVFSGPALAVFGLTVTFAAIDWIMSLEPHWFSSIFGALIAASEVLPAFAFSILVLAFLAKRTAVGEAIGPGLWNDMGNLLLAFVMVWAYLSYSQFFLIWSGNLPEESVWYMHRMHGGWEWVSWMLILFYFAMPFVLLLARDLKRDPNKLVWVAGLVVFMHLLFQHWLVTPSFSGPGHGGPAAQGGEHYEGVRWMDLPALAGIGGLWLAWFFWRLPARTLLPMKDPAMQEEAGHHA